ncbi:formyltransferase family protein [Magnetospirillum sp. 15-1]|uniref:formyltransferase family protein n=1 Tax=Magnetospirillum sp. 15-1 TaxID=1979370 RepID=UPI000BBBA6C0|nr:formyltransferase family protein [Magnetospirillum sp. 15-1]
MLDTILLLAGDAERPVLAEALRRAGEGVRVVAAGSTRDLPADLRTARLVAFVFPEIVPTGVLERLGYGAYNFHPGPPAYPGWVPAAFALYDGATEFGATLHEMTAKVDSGIICDVERFAVPSDCDLQGLETLAYGACLRLFERWAEALVSPLRPPHLPLRWGTRKCTRKAFAEMGRIPEGVPEEEALRRVRAFGGRLDT